MRKQKTKMILTLPIARASTSHSHTYSYLVPLRYVCNFLVVNIGLNLKLRLSKKSVVILY